MKHQECARPFSVYALISILLVAVVAFSGCKNAEASKAEYLSRGEKFLKEKKYQEATLEFRNALQLDDRLAAAHWGLAKAYEGLERYSEAVQEIVRTIELDPNNLDARVRLGNYYMVGKQPNIAEGERLAKEVLAKDPNFIEGHILMASVLYAQDREHPEKALASLNRAIEIDPKRVESYLSLARFYTTIYDKTKAEETLRRAISVAPSSALAHAEYGRFLVSTNRAGEAEAEFRKAVEVEPDAREPRIALGSFYIVNKQFDKAEEVYKALAELEKDKPEGRALLADFYSTIGRYDDAVRVYQEIVAKVPDYTRGRYRLGEIMLQRGDVQGATAQVQEVLKKNERDSQGLMLRARIRMQAGDNRAAIEDLKEVLKQEPNSRSGLYYMAEANHRMRQYDMARSYAADLDKYYPDWLPAKLMQVQIHLESGETKTALRLANELVELISKAAPNYETSPQMLTELRAKALTARGSAHLDSGDAKAARADLVAAKDVSPNDPASYVNLAIVSIKENKIDEAAVFYDQALKIDNVNFDALNGLITFVYVPQKKLGEGHARVDQALAVQPGNASLHYLKAEVYGYERNAEGAEGELRRALELDPKYLAAYSKLAALYINTNQIDRAIGEYRKIIEREPNSAFAYTMMGLLEHGRRNYDGAIENYRKAIEIDANSLEAANNLAWLYAVEGKGNIDEASRLAQGVVQKRPDVPGFADTLGWVYYKQGLHSAAVEQLQKVVSREGGNATYRFHLGMALAGKGDKAGARSELQQALRLGEKGGFADADEARRTLATL
ncbi:MAG TPA: tetratricopeptide repeat protein [Pyrinomonadaceae bacterium]|jgi:tetratricopeptide (TPR) repeat protein